MRDGDILTPAQVLALYEDSAMYDDDMFDGGGCAVAGGGTGPLAQPRAAAPASAAALPGGARVARHPLWPVLVDLYFACRKARGAGERGRCLVGRKGSSAVSCLSPVAPSDCPHHAPPRLRDPRPSPVA